MKDVRVVVQDVEKKDKKVILVQKRGLLKRDWYTYKTIIIDSGLDIKVYTTGCADGRKG